MTCRSTISRREILLIAAAFSVALIAPGAARAQDSAATRRPKRDSSTARGSAPTVLVPLSLFGEVRTRTEWDKPGPPLDADLFTLLRTRLGIRVDAAENARIVVQMQDSRVLGTEGIAGSIATDQLDLHQGYLEASTSLGANASVLGRVGRQEIALANERLVGVNNWSNLGRTLDGARVIARPKKGRWEAEAFASIVEERGRHFGSATTTPANVPDHAFVGAFFSSGQPAHRGDGTLELTTLYDHGAVYRAYSHSDRATLDARISGVKRLGLSVEIEAATQFGHQTYTPPAADSMPARGQLVHAWLLGTRVGPAWDANGRFATSIGFDMLSGATTPTGRTYGAFSTMYASNHSFYGVLDLIPDPSALTKEHGLVDAIATAQLTVSPRLNSRFELHRFEQATGDRSLLGWEGDLITPWRITRAAGLELGYSFFTPGDRGAALGLGKSGHTRHWIYLMSRIGIA